MNLTPTPPHALNLNSFFSLSRTVFFKLPTFCPILSFSLSTRLFQQASMLLWHPFKKFPWPLDSFQLLLHSLFPFTEKLLERNFYNCLEFCISFSNKLTLIMLLSPSCHSNDFHLDQVLIIANTECLLWGRECSKYFVHINSLNPLTSYMKMVLLIFIF